jgi:hypothetical protein
MTRLSRHACTRAQQRSVPPIVVEWLELFGEEKFDGRGGVIRFFSSESRRQLERRVGRRFVAENKKYLDRYLVESATDGAVITTGVLFKPIRSR